MQLLIVNAHDAAYDALHTLFVAAGYDVVTAHDTNAQVAWLATSNESAIVVLDISDHHWGPAEAFLHQISTDPHTLAYHRFVIIRYADVTPPKSFLRATAHLNVHTVTKPLTTPAALLTAVDAAAADLDIQTTCKVRVTTH